MILQTTTVIHRLTAVGTVMRRTDMEPAVLVRLAWPRTTETVEWEWPTTAILEVFNYTDNNSITR